MSCAAHAFINLHLVQCAIMDAFAVGDAAGAARVYYNSHIWVTNSNGKHNDGHVTELASSGVDRVCMQHAPA